MEEINPITAEVIRGSLESITEEMAITMTRTSRCPYFNEGRDFSTAIFDYTEGYKARMVAQSIGLYVHIYATLTSVEALLSVFRYNLHQGDIVLVSDPYHGGSHPQDYTILMPVYHEAKPLFFTGIRAHMADTGGGAPAGYNTEARDVWQETVRIPPIKIYEGSEPRRDVLDWLKANNRLPEMFEGDLQAMIAACKVGERRLKQLLVKYGPETVKGHVEYCMDYAERRTRAEITRWPDGVYEGVAFLDHDFAGNRDIMVKARVTIWNDELTVDFTGSDQTTEGFINSPMGNTWSHVLGVLVVAIPPDIPKNSGLFRPLRIILPQNSVVNAKFPASTGHSTIHIGCEIGESVVKALEKAIPDRITNIGVKIPFFSIYGVDPRNGLLYMFNNFPALMTGCPGTFETDGWGGWPAPFTGMLHPTIEMTEVNYPLQYLTHEFVTDSCGAGQWRGGMGHETRIKNVDHVMYGYPMVSGVKYPLPGINGGKEGPPNGLWINFADPQETSISHTGELSSSSPNHVVRFICGGGGGWGSPLKRDPDELRKDVLDEYISIQAAREDYGVIISPETLEIDYQATEKLREEIRAKGKGG